MSTSEAVVAVVTGGGSGIGRATARLLAQRGAAVALADIDLESARVAAEEIALIGGRAAPLQLDVGDSRAITPAFAEIEKTLGVPTVLVNCAGVLHIAPAIETKIEDFDRVLNVNLRSVFMTCVAFSKELINTGKGGVIVNVTSVHAALSEPNASAYTAAKGGVEAMSRTFASEWARYGIRVNCVRPGATRTALTENLYTPAVLSALENRVPMGRPASPDEIAHSIVFLASPEASYTTGITLDVDGGYRMDGSLPNAEYR